MSRSEDETGKPPATGDFAHDEEGLGRRQLFSRIGTGLVGAALAAPVLLSLRSAVPNALYERPRRFKAGRPDDFGEGATLLADERVFIFREGKTYYCISAVCTHLGCTVQLARTTSGRNEEGREFHCPCHGSRFQADGTPYAGPAPKPLAYHVLEVAPDDGQLVVDLTRPADKGWRLTVQA